MQRAVLSMVLDLFSLAALGILAGCKSKGARRWKLTRPTA